MRTLTCIFLLLLLLQQMAYADGCYLPKIDPRSHSRDISEPSQKAVIAHFQGKERLILQVTYKGDVKEFVWLIPTPAKPEVSKSDKPVFHSLHYATAPRLKYWLDADELLHSFNGFMSAGSPKTASPTDVEVLERKAVGIYDVSVLRAKTAKNLLAWLQGNDYRVHPGMEKVVDDYLRRGWVFTAAKITTNTKGTKKKLNEGTVQALDLQFPAPEPVYPLLISSLNPGQTKIILYVFDEHRVETSALKAECVLSARMMYGPYTLPDVLKGMVDEHSFLEIYQQENYLTKLTGTLSSKQMDRDLVLHRAKSDKIIPRGYVSPPLRENLGAVFILVLFLPLLPPISFITFGLLAVRISGNDSFWRYPVCIASALASFVVWMPIGDAFINLETKHYEAMGAVAPFVMLVLVFAGTIKWRKRKYMSS